MAIKTIEYEVNIAGITPATEQFCGTQGDHRVTQLNYELMSELYDGVESAKGDGKAMYRFDVHDGEGGIWQSEPKELAKNVQIVLEERHTRHGGKITVYLVITVLSEENQTEMELYSFPCVLRLKNRPDGEYQDGESYESVSALVTKAGSYATEAREFANEVVEKLKNGEFDGKDGISVTHSFDGTVLKMTSASGTTMVDLKGEKGEQGPKGDKGESGKDAVTDQTYNPESDNAQSGKAVAEAVSGFVPKLPTYMGPPYDNVVAVYESATVDENGLPLDQYYKHIPIEDESIEIQPSFIIKRSSKGTIRTEAPTKDLDCANKKYVDDLIGDIETALDELHNYAQAIIGGAE